MSIDAQKALMWLRFVGGVVILLLLVFLVVDGRADLESVLKVLMLLLGLDRVSTAVLGRNGHA